MPTYKKLLYEGDQIPASDITPGQFGGSTPYTFPNGVGTDTINEKTAGSGVTIDSVLNKDGEVHMVSGKAESIGRAWLGV